MAATEHLLAVRLQLLKRKLEELEGIAAGLAPAAHSHAIADITLLPETLADLQDQIDAGGGGGGGAVHLYGGTSAAHPAGAVHLYGGSA